MAAAIDPFIYATILYFMLASVFGRSGFDRFVFLVIGISALRWTVVSLLEGTDYAVLRARFTEVVRAPGAAAMCAVIAPPTAVMVLSLGLVVATVLSVDSDPAASLTALPWLALILPIQAVWNAVAILVLTRLKAAQILAGPGPLVLLVGVMWLLSPTLYIFTDLPASASLLFTTLNPVSHLLAAYYNALWHGVTPSFDVLPAAGAAALILLGLLSWQRRQPQARVNAPAGNPLLVVADATDPETAVPSAITAAAPVYRPWSRHLQGLSGRDLAELMIAAGGRMPLATAVQRVVAESRLGRLFDDQVAIYPSWGMAQLAYGFAIASPARTLVLDGVLDAADPMFAAQAWARIAAETAAGRRIVVVTYRLFDPPVAGGGRFVAVRGTSVVREGEIGAELSAFYDEVMELGGLPDPADGD
jgi:ABC-type polysaccharide/polyol phosphate export permease